ncbi:response regulator [Candidatus Woesearchaeota archaeon]|nr:response regulator [Candidatus Woesearchaeota archaeon]
MEELQNDITTKIKKYLLTTKHGASSTIIAKNVGNNRVTIAKYLEIMKAQDIVSCEEIGNAKIWNLTEKMSHPTILIVDDELNVINLIKLSLQGNNYNLIDATSGKIALEKVKEYSPDIIILDLMMPEMNGFEVCKKIKENPLTQHIHVIILSAKGQLEDKMKGLTFGADDYMTKPFEPKELESRISLLLRYEENEQLLHPITKLPTKARLTQHIKKRVDNNEQFTIFNFSIENFDKYIDTFGCKKANELLVLMARVLLNAKNINLQENITETFVGHTLENSFVVVSKDKTLDESILQSFQKIQPFLYTDNAIEESKIQLNVVKLSHNQIDIENNKLIDILPLIKVEE